MKILSAAFVLAFSFSALAGSVLPQNMKLAKSLATDERDQEIWDLFYNGKELKPSQLKGDALAAYKNSDKENRCAEVIIVESLKNLPLIHVCDQVEGNGCEHVFNMKGEYLNSMCGSESSEWHFERNP